MSEPTLYRINRTRANPTDEDLWQHLIGRGVLVPVERCEHGRIDSHYEAGYVDQGVVHEPVNCPGAVVGGDDE